MNIYEKLQNSVKKNNSLVCVGLDPDVTKIPQFLRQDGDNALFEFNKAIIDTTANMVCAFKPNSAFYEAYGVDGIWQLRMTTMYIKQQYPDIVIILDAKRGDIGSTNEGYVRFAYDYLGVDAITLQPYLGKESLKPFLEREDKAAIILCRTSNPGAGEFQDLMTDGEALYKKVAKSVVAWNTHNNCMLVTGATYPQELADIRSIVGDMPFLVPGVGAQGGDINKIMKSGLDSHKTGLIINSSRGVIYASDGEDFADAAKREVITLRDEINKYRTVKL
ncbi:MAG: orotidine-5-phosphate decarboxylase [Candidatus Parcubacteria bacterium]|jgi:orotidine-5'-phosphate decarboxylase